MSTVPYFAMTGTASGYGNGLGGGCSFTVNEAFNDSGCGAGNTLAGGFGDGLIISHGGQYDSAGAVDSDGRYVTDAVSGSGAGSAIGTGHEYSGGGG